MARSSRKKSHQNEHHGAQTLIHRSSRPDLSPPDFKVMVRFIFMVRVSVNSSIIMVS